MEPTIRFELPDWEPLERALPEAWLDGWMFMAFLPHPDGGDDLRAYKHQITRRYLHLRLEGGAVQAYRYTADDAYVPSKLVEDVEIVYATIERLGYTREIEAVERDRDGCAHSPSGPSASSAAGTPTPRD